jgi:hypothetical protein
MHSNTVYLPYVLDLLTDHILTLNSGPLATFTTVKGICSVLVVGGGPCTQSCGTCQLNTSFSIEQWNACNTSNEI